MYSQSYTSQLSNIYSVIWLKNVPWLTNTIFCKLSFLIDSRKDFNLILISLWDSCIIFFSFIGLLLFLQKSFKLLKSKSLNSFFNFFGCLPTSHEWYKCSLINGSITGFLDGKTIENVSNVLVKGEQKYLSNLRFLILLFNFFACSTPLWVILAS